jgi:uncharacterized protein YbjT (DUF2867 family)
MYTILGATGHTGRIVADTLLARREKVRVVGRDAKRLEGFTQKGAEAFVADATDATAMTKAFSGAKAAYALVPPKIDAADVRAYQEQVNAALVSAAEKSGISHVVVLSSVGADKPDRTGPVIGLHNLESKLDAIAGLNTRYLRAGYFMENILPQAGVIGSLGSLAGPLRADLNLPMIATRDIGAVAAEALLTLDFQGKNRRELLGARDVSYAELAKIVGAAIDKPGLGYKQVRGMMLKPVFMQLGMSANMADLLLEMCDALNAGYMKPLEPRSPLNTTPTTIEKFLTEVFVPVYRGKAAGAQ